MVSFRKKTNVDICAYEPLAVEIQDPDTNQKYEEYHGSMRVKKIRDIKREEHRLLDERRNKERTSKYHYRAYCAHAFEKAVSDREVRRSTIRLK